MIPHEAVEAAAKQVWRDSAMGRRTCEAWEGLSDREQIPCLDAARTILEAAAPHLFAPLLALADERDETPGAIRGHITTHELRQTLNPYRSQA